VISILPITRVVGAVAVSYGVCVALIVAIVWKIGDEPTLKSSMGIALSGGTVLNLLILFLIYIGWKRIWSLFPVRNNLVFPDLNGAWKMRIHWHGMGTSGIVPARVQIKQDLLRISMEVYSRDSDSETLAAVAKRDPESGRPMLYYVYRVVPKKVRIDAGASYEGSAILKISDIGNDRLSGNYFTSKQTLGHFELTR
jgi:SMODS-associating 2TM, beta-strand rich effector domain